MKTLVTKTIVALTITLAGAFAHADLKPAWVCSLNFQGTTKGVQLIIGKSEFNGAGTISCVSSKEERTSLPVTVKMHSGIIAPRIGVGVMELYGEALQVPVFGTPESLLGSYVVAEGRAALVGGAGVLAAVHAGDNGLALDVSLQLVKGIGFDIGFRQMDIALDTSRAN
ncbi:MAG: hypothetical protein ACXWQQ_14695 [Pseudobdellovibrio sp.]